MTTKIQIPDYLAEYFTVKYWDQERDTVRFPESCVIRAVIGASLRKRPQDHPVDTGNFEFLVPNIEAFGKNPVTWNYIPEDRVRGHGKKRRGIVGYMEDEFWLDVYDQIHEYRSSGLEMKDAVLDFLDRYGVKSYDPDSLLHQYRRWIDRQRHRSKRKYVYQDKNRKNKL